MMNDLNTRLTQLYGTGWSFPLRFATPGLASKSSLEMSAGIDNVKQSLALLFQTQPGERMMLPSWGCDLHSAMFANMAEGTLSALQSQIAESVARYEPRAEKVTVRVQEDRTQHGVLNITVIYHLAGHSQQVSGQLYALDGGGGSVWATL